MPTAEIIVPAVGAVASGIAGFFGARDTNKTNQAEAAKNRSFQERMRNTAWQAGVEDMRAAGLNPALAYGAGPAASPGGATSAAAENTVSSAMQAMQMQKGLKLMDHEIKKASAEADIAKDDERLNRQRVNLLINQEGDRPARLRQQLDKEIELLDARVGSTRSQGAAAQAQADSNWRAELMNFLRNPGGSARNFIKGWKN